MKTKKVKALQNMTMFIETEKENIHLQPMNGRMLVNTVERCSLFVPNKPRGPRSVEIMRTNHARMVRRPNGKYSISIQFSPEEFHISEQLMLEIGTLVNNPLLNLKNRVA